MTSNLRDRLLLGLPGLALATVVVTVILEGHDAERLLNAAQAGLGLLIVWGVAVAVQVRYPDRPMGRLLFALATIYVLLAFQASRNPVLFTLARASRPAAEVLLVWIMLSFPSGRLSGRLERTLVISAALAVLLLWVPSAMLSAQFPIAGPMLLCRDDCPRNVLFVAEMPELARALSLSLRVVGAAVLMATAAVLFNRLRRATPLMRRALAPLLLASIARASVTAIFLVGSGAGSRLAFTATFFAVPLAIALGLLRGRLYTARALQRLVSGLRERPDMHELRRVMADALGDDSLKIAYWIKDRDQWVDAEGLPLALPYPSSEQGRAATLVRDSAGQPVAALVHDVALLEEPTLVESVASTMLVALESHRLEAELKASSARTASAVEAERHRIERDLHDGAQQRLIALRMKLSVTSRLLQQDPRRVAALVDEMGGDVEAAIADLRAYAHGVVPPLLLERGLAFALAEVAQRSPIPTRTSFGDIGRCDPAIERAVYFCCLEALQNAAKHGGPAATAQVTLQRIADTLHFSVEDDGVVSAGTARATGGQGLANMRERIAAVGGHLAMQSRPDRGFQVTGSVVMAGPDAARIRQSGL
ncbi:sensor histidine kinase [Ideonella sp. A 288]|uniref:sensor histidine kinase n=1 Tax=Ideonella sp. A 288 TaxID=1962181 RepID=UPI000B4C062B|nr:histidine kinase [Ideonella sp. A 288]